MSRRDRGKRRFAAQQRERHQALHLRQTEIVHFSGPIPSPGMLRAYGEVIKDGAERVFRMAERQGSHRRRLETLSLLVQLVAIIAGAGISAALGYGGWLLARDGQSLFGIAAIIVALGTPASIFVYGFRRHRDYPSLDDTE